MTFDEWWYKYGIEIDIPKNEACVIWMAALNNAEALKPSHNISVMPCQYGHGFCVNVNTGKCFSCHCSNYEVGTAQH